MKYTDIICAILLAFSCARDDSNSTTNLRTSGQSNGTSSVKLPDTMPPIGPGSESAKVLPTAAPSDQVATPDKVVVDPTGTIAKVVNNKGQVQRSRLTRIDVFFNTKLIVDASAFALMRQGEAPVPVGKINVSLSEVNGATTAGLTFAGAYVNAGSLNEGLWKFSVSSAKVNAAGGKMTGDYEMFTHCLFGDVNGEKTVDI